MDLDLPPMNLNPIHCKDTLIAPVQVANGTPADELVKGFASERTAQSQTQKGGSTLPVHVLRTRLCIKLDLFAVEVPLHWAEIAGAVHDEDQLSMVVVVLQRTPGERNAWLLDVCGGISDMQKVLARLSSAGALRSDFQQAYEQTGTLIGKGSFGFVYCHRGREIGSGKTAGSPPVSEVAAKVLSVDKVNIKLLKAEVKCMAQVPAHPNIVSLCGVFSQRESNPVHPASWILVMEYCPHNDLLRFLKAGGICSEIDTFYIVRGVFAALLHLHTYGVIHRDVKPENILLRDRGEIALCDFGIAACVDDDAELSVARGSPGYFPPEAVAQTPITASADIFSTGVVMFLMLSGHQPFYCKDFETTMKRTYHCRVEFEQYAAFSIISEAAKKLIRLCLQKPRAKRPKAEQALSYVQDYIIFKGVPRSSRLLNLGRREEVVESREDAVESGQPSLGESGGLTKSTSTASTATVISTLAEFPVEICRRVCSELLGEGKRDTEQDAISGTEAAQVAEQATRVMKVLDETWPEKSKARDFHSNTMLGKAITSHRNMAETVEEKRLVCSPSCPPPQAIQNAKRHLQHRNLRRGMFLSE